MVIADDYNAVRVAAVQGVQKPDADYLHWLTVQMGGQTTTLRFPDHAARDDFYKKLVDAMGQ